MSVSIFSQSVDVRSVSFNEQKYGPRMLVDVAWITDMPAFARTVEPYTLDFYDITLVTAGNGRFWLDDQEYRITPGSLLFTSPGQVRRWYVEDLQGICLFFPAQFILEHFSDPLFLHRLHYFHTRDGMAELALTKAQQTQLLERFNVLRSEIAELQWDSEELLRSVVHEVLVYLNRWYVARHGQIVATSPDKTIVRFRQALEQYFARYHKVAEYAALLAVTPGHLNVLCKSHLGQGASQLISARIFSEAARRLVHTQVGVEALSEQLGFRSSSYFCRAFKREKGLTPLQYRHQERESLFSI